MRSKHARLTICAFAMLLLILDSKSAAQAASEGIGLCLSTVIPALFPFFVLSSWMTGAFGGAVSRIFEALFQLPAGCGGILLTGLLGGYPVGAQALSQARECGAISGREANRMLAFCSQAGPSFLFGMAAAQFPSAHYGWLLWAVQILSALSVARLLPHTQRETSNIPSSPSPSISDAMKRAVMAMASVCGWVVVFRVVISFLSRWMLWLLPEACQILLCGLLELTNGCVMLDALANTELRFLAAALMLNFGGFCVVLQTVSVTRGLDIRYYLLGKLLQSGFALLYGCLFLRHYSVIIPLAGIFSGASLLNRRKNSSIPAPVGV